jgi:hypothetical protein
MHLFGQAPAPLTFAQQQAQQRLIAQQQLDQQKLTGSQQLATQRQQDTAARQQAQIQASQASSAAFFASLQAGGAGNQDLARSVAERSAAWIQPPRVQQEAGGSNLGLILGITGGAAVLILAVVLLLKR